MEYTIIEVPDMNDSFSRVTLAGKAYLIRFTYIDTSDTWNFGLYTLQKEAIAVGMKIVPKFPLNAFFGVTRLPLGVFGVFTKLSRIGRNDFKNGNAKFIYYPIPKA